MEGAVLCADIGTSSVKAALVDSTGTVAAYARVRFNAAPHAPRRDCAADAPLLLDGNEWLGSLALAARELVRISPGTRIEAVCVSGNGPTVATDTGRVLPWNAPATDGAEQEIRRQLDGTPARKSLFVPRLMLFRELFPAEWNSASLVMSGPEYLLWRLTGNAVTVLPEERFKEAYWTDGALRAAGLPAEKIPPFVLPGRQIGKIGGEAAAALAIQAGIPVFSGAPDFVVALIGTGTLEPGTICDRAGSSEGLNLCLSVPPEGLPGIAGEMPGIRFLPSVMPGLHNASVLIPDSGSRFGALKQEIAPETDYAEFVAALLENPPLSRRARAMMDETAGLVGEAFGRLARISELSGNGTPRRMRTTGGQARNAPWLQHKADMTGIPIEVTACPDAELVGDAVLALVGTGRFGSVLEGAKALVKVARVFSPGEGQ